MTLQWVGWRDSGKERGRKGRKDGRGRRKKGDKEKRER
jgi:hypothetical protein